MSPDSIPDLAAVAAMGVDDALELIETSTDGLTQQEATRRLELYGPNAVRSHRVQPFVILAHQFANPIQLLLLAAAGVSMVVGERTNAAIVTLIVSLSVVLGFVNELRSERAVEALARPCPTSLHRSPRRRR